MLEKTMIALAQELNARLIIIDDLKARRRAKHLKLPFKGGFGVLMNDGEGQALALR